MLMMPVESAKRLMKELQAKLAMKSDTALLSGLGLHAPQKVALSSATTGSERGHRLLDPNDKDGSGKTAKSMGGTLFVRPQVRRAKSIRSKMSMGSQLANVNAAMGVTDEDEGEGDGPRKLN